ncbi:DNA-binding HxlR family transcriptional regulator [Erwinia toletana]|uniref:DNA-binding HxlR family transcriptional regulator n=2 Tax=Winslowiella toletana TaxID=92490 RepID=A0ABS4P5D9_9GAMM|nr:DNA-binding HxlR family transcriptional regulator [Winslowiella toletana]
MSANNQQTAEQPGPEVMACNGDSASRLLLDQITDKWSVLILTVLCKQPQRFNEIKRQLEGITQKSLTQSLRRLERNGILARRVIPASQIAVEYSITPLGRTLEAPFQALYLWTVSHSAAVMQAQAQYDQRTVEEI